MLLTLTICPPFPRSIAQFAKARAQWSAPATLTARNRAASSASAATSGRSAKWAALLTRMSSWPKRSTVSATIRSQSAATPTSAAIARTAEPVASSISAAAWASVASVRPAMARRAPWRAKARAIPKPTPAPPPVTTTTLPAKFCAASDAVASRLISAISTSVIASPLEPVVLRKALRRQATGFGAVSDPFVELGPGDGEGAAGGIAPGETLGDRKNLCVRHAAVLVALEARALAARHFVELGDREYEQLAVLADDSDVVARGGDGERGRRLAADVEHGTALAGRRRKLVLADDEAVAVGGDNEPLRAGRIRPDGDDRSALIDVGHEADRLALPAAARQFCGVEGEYLAVARQNEKFRRRLGEERGLQAVVTLEACGREVGDLASERADPALLRDDNGQRLALDHRLGEIGDDDLGRNLEAGAPPAELRVWPEPLLDVADLDCDHPPLPAFAGQQRLDRGLLPGQIFLLRAQRHLLETPQAPQARVEHIDDLRFGQAEAGFERLFRILLFADDAYDLVEVEENHNHAGHKLEPPVDRRKAPARAPDQHAAAMVEPLLQGFAKRDDPWRHPVDQHIHVHRNAGLELAQAEERLHQGRRLDRAGLGLEHDADVLGRLVADVGEQRQFLLVEQVGDLFDETRLLHPVGDLGDDRDPAAPTSVLPSPTGPHAEAAASGAVGLGDRRPVVDDDAAGREIGALHELEKRLSLGLGMVDEMERSVAELGDVVRRDRGRHADCDALRAVGEQVRHGRGHDDRLSRIARIVVAPVDRILLHALHQEAGDVGHPGFGIAVGGGVVAVDVAEIALPLDQRIARGKILSEAHQRLVDRLVPVGMEGAHHVADDLGAFLERRAGVEPQDMHAVEDAAMNGLKAVARVRQRPAHDGRKRIGEIALFECVA